MLAANRAATVTNLAKVGVDENQLTKVAGHGNINYIKSYLQLNQKLHQNLVNKIGGK